MKKAIAALLLFGLLASLSGALAEYVSVTDLYRQYSGQRWQGEYETIRGETVTVDAPFLIPEVETAPVILVGEYPYLDAAFQRDYTSPNKKEARWKRFGDSRDHMAIRLCHDLEISVNPEWNFMITFQEEFVAAEDISPALYAENNPMSMAEALERVTQIYNNILTQYGSSAPVPFLVEYGYTLGLYKAKNKAPLCDHRAYGFEAKPIYRGFPLLSNVSHNYIPSYKTNYLWEGTYHAHLNLKISSPDCYSIAAHLRQEIQELAPDIPLLDFSKPQAQLISLIEQGKVRAVRKIYLAYVSYCEPTHDSHKTNRWVLFPTWVVDGDYYPSPKDGPSPGDATEFSYFTRSGFHYLLFNPQTGAFLDPTDTAKSRSDAPRVIQWGGGQSRK